MTSSVRIAVTICIIIALIFTTAYTIVIIKDVKTDFLDWNKSPETNYLPILVSYPDSPTILIGGRDNESSVCTIKFLLKYNGSLVENTPVEIVNATCISYVDYKIVASIYFPQAIPYNWKDSIGDNSSLYLSWAGTEVVRFEDKRQNDGRLTIEGLGASIQETFYFPVSGDYSPMIGLHKNTELLPSSYYRFDQIKVHVISQAELGQEKTNKVNLGLTVALLGFSYIGAFALVYELVVKDNYDKAKDRYYFPINININPEIKKPNPTINKPKNVNESKDEPNKENNTNRISKSPRKESPSPN